MMFTGPQSRFSFRLGDDRLAIDPRTKNPVTSQIASRLAPYHCEKINPDRVKTIIAKMDSIRIWNMAAQRIFDGSLPGYFPPSV